MAYNEHWLKLNGFESEEEARRVMAERGAKGKGKPKSFNPLRDRPGWAKEVRRRGIENGSKKVQGNKG